MKTSFILGSLAFGGFLLNICSYADNNYNSDVQNEEQSDDYYSTDGNDSENYDSLLGSYAWDYSPGIINIDLHDQAAVANFWEVLDEVVDRIKQSDPKFDEANIKLIRFSYFMELKDYEKEDLTTREMPNRNAYSNLMKVEFKYLDCGGYKEVELRY